MAKANVILEDPHTGESAEAPLGYSWTTLFFGLLPAVFRGDWKWAGIMLLVGIVTSWLSAILIFPFIYNRLYLTKMLRQGWKVAAVKGGTIGEVAQQIGFDESRIVSHPS